ncbi:Hypothetical predicted protein [Cloeon dipterum]|uniref:Cytochrome P450 n=1 Tax=Cloeon dipterum TaxID=197152 RepID=A0A8S1BYU9_9INSE|nr:Hypothetical predicted protein [Cloeon dipterum]
MTTGQRGIPFIKPVPFFGSMINTVLKTRAFADVFVDNYKELKPNGFGGIYEFMQPTLMVTSPELIRDMTVKNFDFFHDRRIIVTKDTDPLFARSLPGLKGDEWREMRNKLSPAFTASKLKHMFPHISKCASQFAKFLLTREGAKTQPIEFKTFGVETNAVQNPEEKFYKNAQIMTDFGALRSLIALGFMVFPKLMAALGFSFTPKDVTNYFKQLIKGAMEYREKKNISRPDMLQLLMAAQKGKLKNEADEDVGTVGEDIADSELHKKHMATKKSDSIKITDEDIAAQAFIFFFAGYETVATVLAFLAHELAENPEVQERLREEVDATIQEGPLSYESVMGMKYLDMVISETLRKYPPAVGTDRTCIKNYKIPGTDHVIEAGMILSVPIFPLHRDPEYFPEPEKFDPERFSEENKADIKPYTYLPFGVGPHNCIGMRFALLEVKLCAIHLLATCKLRVCTKTEIPLQLSKKSFAMTTDNGFCSLWERADAKRPLNVRHVDNTGSYSGHTDASIFIRFPLFGNMIDAILQKKSFADLFAEQYNQLKPHGFGGIYEFMKPTFIVTSPELLRDIAVKNFDFFHDRRVIVSKDADPLFARSLPSLEGEEWREMRNKLSPAFTASKLKLMFPNISKCASQFAKFLITREEAKTQPIEFKSTFTRMTNDVIATTAFGVETNAVQNPEEKFYKYAHVMTNFGPLRSLIALGFVVFPKLMVALGLSLTPKEASNYFQQLIKGTMEYREEKNISRPDMLQLLMAAQKGKLKKEGGEDVGTIGEDNADSELHKKHMASKTGGSNKITDQDIAAQAFFFFSAGYDSVSTVLAFLSHELAENQEVQERLREEVDATIQDGPLSYESVMGMKYLDMVVSEILRKYPPAVGTDRVCTKNYKIPGTDKVIPAGTVLSVPIYPLHRDPEYFPEPGKFDPERFSEENKADIKPYTYLPFGVGPHNCIGMRFALLEVKLCAIHLLATCKLRVCTKTEIPLQLSKKSFAMTTDNGFWLLAIPRENPTLKV